MQISGSDKASKTWVTNRTNNIKTNKPLKNSWTPYQPNKTRQNYFSRTNFSKTSKVSIKSWEIPKIFEKKSNNSFIAQIFISNHNRKILKRIYQKQEMLTKTKVKNIIILFLYDIINIWYIYYDKNTYCTKSKQFFLTICYFDNAKKYVWISILHLFYQIKANVLYFRNIFITTRGYPKLHMTLSTITQANQ